MRIAIDYTPAVRQGAGIGRLTRHLVRALVELNAPHTYTLFVAGPLPAGSTSLPPVYGEREGWSWPANVRLRATTIPERYLTILWHRLRLPLPAEHFVGPCDIFHSTDFVLPPVRRARTLLTVHDLTFLRFPNCADPGLRAYLSAVVPRSLARAGHILADSQATKRDLVELLAVAPERISVIYGGIEARFSPAGDVAEDAATRRRYGLDRPYILSVSTLEPRKNYERLLRAFAALRQSAGLPHLLAIAGGKGWLYEGIFAEAERLKLGDAVRFLGFVPDAHLPALYRGADLFAFPSLYEGFGFPPLEAMACGCPVVCSNTSSLPEIVGDAALLVSPTDEEELAEALRLALTDGARRQAMIAAGRRQAAGFTWQASARQLLVEYERLGAGLG